MNEMAFSSLNEMAFSSFLSAIFDKLASKAFETLAPFFETGYDIEKLKRSSLHIQSLLADAYQRETTDQSVKRWLSDLRHLAYDIEDILDDAETEAMRREWTDQSETRTNKVRKLCLSPFSKHSSPSRAMKDKINAATTKLQELIKEKNTLGLVVKEETTSVSINRRLQTSMIHASSIFGRQVEKEALVHKLLQDEPCGQNFGIVPIVGMGGVGKTSLARLLYEDEQVKVHFETKAWVCVSNQFDRFRVSKEIFEAMAKVNKEFTNFNLLQESLRDLLMEKKFLLVLDDVWSDSCEDWETLVHPFHVCAPGSKIIITARKDQLLKMLGYNNLNQLRSLSLDDALSLLALHALGVKNFDSHLSLKPLGLSIVKKCDGLPLALKALGRLLSTKNDEEVHWKKVLDSEIWRSPIEGEIIPALLLSYNDLSVRLKQLFAYCSLFPKNYVFDKEQLVQLWMAEGFLQQSTSSDSIEECLGREYFDELLSRSFFQHIPNNKSLFVMHDLMNDLATFVAGGFFLRLEKNTKMELFERYRHMSFVHERYVPYKKSDAFKSAKSLRTFLVGVVDACFFLSNKILIDLLPELQLLRVLCLSDFAISEVPESIGTLKHLRYLNLSRTGIKHLPESVCNLYNLQTLILFGCDELAKLPESFLKLKNMRHIDIRDTPLLDQIPLGIGELKSLQTLSKFIITCENGFDITELKDLKNLTGKISILGLERVQYVTHVREANFSQKRLSELEVVWGDMPNGLENEMLEKEVLNELKPRNDCLKQLKIVSYGGLKFPNWVGDPSFLQLMHVSIRGCKKCTSLPPLGQLLSLKELFMEGLDGVKVIGFELLGTSSAFPSLEVLSLKKMGRLEKWSTNNGVVFPCLQQLHIEDCPNLVEVSLETLLSMNVLEIRRCDSGVLRRLVEVGSSITKLEIISISGLSDAVWRGVIKYLEAVEELKICGCNEIRYLWESEAVASKVLLKLRNLKVFGCDNLLSLGEKEGGDKYRRSLLTSLKMLDVSHCNNMESCSCPGNIETLRVSWCSSITSISLPRGGQKLKALNIWGCKKLVGRERGRRKKIINTRSMPMLEVLDIRAYPYLKSVTELNYLVNLTTLRIESCESLESFPGSELSILTSLKEVYIISCPRMDASFPCGVWPLKLHSLQIGKLKKPMSEWGPQSFPTSLVELHLLGDDGVSSCRQISHLLPSSLISLHIKEFEKLESISTGLQHLASLQHLSFEYCPNLNKLSHPKPLTSLQHLSFKDCPNMMDLPELMLSSLLRLSISECPNLEERMKLT